MILFLLLFFFVIIEKVDKWSLIIVVRKLQFALQVYGFSRLCCVKLSLDNVQTTNIILWIFLYKTIFITSLHFGIFDSSILHLVMTYEHSKRNKIAKGEKEESLRTVEMLQSMCTT